MSLYTIVYRSTKGSPLTNSEVDGNFQAFDTYKVNVDGSMPFTGPVTAPSFVGVHNGILQNSGVSQFGTGTQVGYGATANQEVDFFYATNNVNRWFTSINGTAGQYFKLNYTDTSGNYKGNIFTADNSTGIATFTVNPQTSATLATADSSANLVTSAWVNAQGYITANGTAKYVTTITSAQVTGSLGYTPVQQGTGTGQGTNVIKIGWGTNTGNGVKITVDSSDMGFIPMSSTAPGTFTYSGAIVATGNITAYSDESLKQNWGKLPMNFVEQLTEVKSGSFDRVDLDNERQIGVSAQSLRSVIPEAVQQNEGGLLSVSYGNAALVAAIELAKRVVELEQRLAALEGK